MKLSQPTPFSPLQTREEILARFPWVRQQGCNMVLDADLDALLSGLLMHHFWGWTPIGIYNLNSIFAAEGHSNQALKESVWVDLDIARQEIKSIGHHILTNRATEQLPVHEQSLNPNLLRGISVQQFARKYPLATLHFLMWLTDQPEPGRDTDQYLLWLPDSCWITAQDRWLPNVQDWLNNWLPVPFLLRTVDRCRTREYEEGMQGFLQDLRRQVSLAAGRGQTKSKWLNLTGYQFRYRDPRVQAGDIQAAIDYLVSLTGWKRMVIPTDYREIPGVRNCHERDLADFIVRENIFSYAIPNSGVINFTSFEDL